jgi:hypothetical protein
VHGAGSNEAGVNSDRKTVSVVLQSCFPSDGGDFGSASCGGYHDAMDILAEYARAPRGYYLAWCLSFRLLGASKVKKNLF